MELRIVACLILSYVSIYALFWLFENRDSLLHAKPPADLKELAADIGASITSCAMGLVGFAVRSFGIKMREVEKLPPPAQIWGAVVILFAAVFLLTGVRGEDCFELIFWIYVALLSAMVLFPLGKLALKAMKK